jgi:hypothetical protein
MVVGIRMGLLRLYAVLVALRGRLKFSGFAPYLDKFQRAESPRFYSIFRLVSDADYGNAESSHLCFGANNPTYM